MTIGNLVSAVPVPVAPIMRFSGPWEPIEAHIGTKLPQDYKDFIRLYGRGYFLQFLGINVPICRNPYTRLTWGIDAMPAMFPDDEEYPYPFWPAPGGLLICGGTDNGDHIFWLTRGSPEEWRMVTWEGGIFDEFEVFDCDLTDFLAGLRTGEIRPKAFPEY